MSDMQGRAAWMESGSLLADLESNWYAAQIQPRHEKRVAERLAAGAIECFLPLYESVHRWKDRRRIVSLPLFPGYVFVRIPLKERLTVLRVPSVIKLVGFDGLPAPVPAGEIDAIREGLACKGKAQPHPFLAKGNRVRVIRGPLEGLEGILVRKHGQSRLVLSVELIMRSVAVEVDASEVEAIGKQMEFRRAS